MSVTKILTVTLEFEMSDRKMHGPRIKAAYESAVSAAVDAAKSELLGGSVNTVHSRMSWDYRYGHGSTTTEYTETQVEEPGGDELEG